MSTTTGEEVSEEVTQGQQLQNLLEQLPNVIEQLKQYHEQADALMQTMLQELAKVGGIVSTCTNALGQIATISKDPQVLAIIKQVVQEIDSYGNSND